jgi:hypothetical protein
MRALRYSVGTTLASAAMVVGMAGSAGATTNGGGGSITNSFNTNRTITITHTVTVTKSKTNSGIIQKDGENQTAIQGDNSAVAKVRISQEQVIGQSNDQSNSAGDQSNYASIKYNSTGGVLWLEDNNESSSQTNTLTNTNSQSMSQSNSNSQSQTVSQSATGVSM